MFLFIFLFHIVGYYILYLGLSQKAHIEITQRLDDENYLEEETITIKIPFNLPYQVESKAFERTHGDFQHNGEFYKLVKQRVENDTLYVVCIQDKKEKKIFNLMTEMVKMSADFPASTQSAKLLNSLIKDYVPLLSLTIISHQGWLSNVAYHEKHFNLLTRNHSVFSPPPEFLS